MACVTQQRRRLPIALALHDQAQDRFPPQERPGLIVDEGPMHAVNQTILSQIVRSFLVAILSLLTGCDSTSFRLPGAPDSATLYATIFPYYIEVCAVSAMKKKHGLGFEYQGGSGGHAVAYLNGVCRVPNASFPEVQMCGASTSSADDGVGLSSNGHFSNVAWVASPGRNFFFDGALLEGESVTSASYRRTQEQAKQLGILNGVRFHEDVFDRMPSDMTRKDFMYEASVATDYAISIGRGRYCGRLPVSKAQMRRVVTYLNADNARYHDGPSEFNMTVLGNNCSHFTHNLLAAAGLWAEWPTDRFFLVSALSFPVPKNEFVNQMLRANNMPLDDPLLLFHDAASQRELQRDGWLPTGPGAIAIAGPIRYNNIMYDTDVNLIFYDSIGFGSFRYQFTRITTDRRYFDLLDNLRHFATVYVEVGMRLKPAEWWLAHGRLSTEEAPSFLTFYKSYSAYVDRMRDSTRLALLTLRRATQPDVLAAHDPSRQ